MPLAFLAIGAVLILVAIRNTHGTLATLLKDDFTGGGGGGPSFVIWLGAIAAVWALGLVPALKYPARLLLALIVMVIFLQNRGVFANIASAIKNPPAATAAPAEPTLPAKFPVEVTQQGGSGGGSGGGAGGAGDILGTAAKVAPLLAL